MTFINTIKKSIIPEHNTYLSGATKPFLTIEEQIDVLLSRNLIIDDKEFAKKRLTEISYYKLINGYSKFFHISSDKEIFREGVRFEDINNLYIFDTKLRELFLSYILKYEVKLKAKIAYYFSSLHPLDADLNNGKEFYRKKENYKNTADENTLNFVINNFEGARKRQVNDRPNSAEAWYYTHYNEYIPLWVQIDSITFGHLTAVYQVAPQQVSDKIAPELGKEFKKSHGILKNDSKKNYFRLTYKNLNSINLLLRNFRNAAAHSDRFFNIAIKRNESKNYVSRRNILSFFDPEHKNNVLNEIPNNNLYLALFALKIVTPKNDFSILVNKLEFLLIELVSNSPILNEIDIFKAMNLPYFWKEYLELTAL